MAEFKPIPSRRNFNNLTGQKFGSILVLGYCGKRLKGKTRITYWLCRCDCGKVWEVAHGQLVHVTRSCGCLRIHHMKFTKEYGVWIAMKQRCYNKKNICFENYGGRGITVCDEWLNDFPRFFADMGPRPSPKHSIDRIDNDGPYCAENCRWATAVEQASNKTTNRLIEIDGVIKTLTQWCRDYGIPEPTAHRRLSAGWSVMDALTKPRQQQRPLEIPDGVDIPKHVIRDRLRSGWSFERAISEPWKPRH